MRQTLFRIALDAPWSGWVPGPDGNPYLGACWLWIIFCIGWVAYHVIRRQFTVLNDRGTWVIAAAGLVALSFLHKLPVFPDSVPVFGYGVMVLIGFLGALIFSYVRAKAVGLDPEVVMDSAFWILVSGVVGGRLAYLWQYREKFFQPGISLPEALFQAINLSGGGLVLLGALLGGGLGVFGYFWIRKLNVFEYADLLMPGVFIGVGFGRIGCLLNGCCFGDRCDLPWAIVFPKGSVTFDIIMERGFLPLDALTTMPLHPTQIYSSLDGFLLAFVTATFYWYRKHPGDVLALGCILYSITRFFIEFLRSDEMGQLGTGLTISQLYCLGVLGLGIALLLTGRLRGPVRQPLRNLPEKRPNP